MKKLLLIISLFSAVQSQALTITSISQLQEVTTAPTNWLFLITRPNVANYKWSVLQFENWLAKEPTFVSTLATNLNITGAATNFTTQTYSPNVLFTNTVSWWATNASFVSISPFTPNPVFSARLVISNTAASTITNTLPFTAYSISLGTNVTKVLVLGLSVLDLQFDSYNGVYYVKDYGKNNSTLSQIANSTNSGSIYITNGVITIR